MWKTNAAISIINFYKDIFNADHQTFSLHTTEYHLHGPNVSFCDSQDNFKIKFIKSTLFFERNWQSLLFHKETVLPDI